MKLPFCQAIALGLSLSCLSAHEGTHGNTREKNEAYQPEAAVEVEGGKRVIQSNGIPNHRTGEFPNRNNPNAIRPQTHRYEVPLQARRLEQVRDASGMPFGVALNGVPFDPGTAEIWENNPSWRYEALGNGRNLGLDGNHAHVQPTGAYHYHGMPTGLLRELGAKRTQMTLVGWAADGYPIYAGYALKRAEDAASGVVKMKSSYRVRKGKRPQSPEGPGGSFNGDFVQDYEYVAGLGDLDECNGRQGVTPEYPDGTYYYVITEEFPSVPRYFRGEPDPSFMRRGPRGGQGGPPSEGRGRPHEHPRHPPERGGRPPHRPGHPDGPGGRPPHDNPPPF